MKTPNQEVGVGLRVDKTCMHAGGREGDQHLARGVGAEGGGGGFQVPEPLGPNAHLNVVGLSPSLGISTGQNGIIVASSPPSQRLGACFT